MKKFLLNIAEPCHEDWDKMTKVEKGKFCGSCQKEVIDFSRMSDAQLAAFFKKPASGSVCGRFMSDQLDRDIEIPRKRIPWLKYFFTVTIPVFLFSAKSNAQGKPRVVSSDTIPVCHVTVGMIVAKVDKPAAVQGRVVDENDSPVPYASIIIPGTVRGVAADSLGNFSIDNTLLGKSTVLKISAVGFHTKELNLQEAPGFVTIKLEAAQTMTGVTITSYGVVKGKITTGEVSTIVGGLSLRYKKDTLIPVMKERSYPKEYSLQVFPNPALASSDITMDCQKLKAGYYVFQLIGLGGQQVDTRSVLIDKGARSVKVSLPTVAAGIYVIKMICQSTGKNYTSKINIQ